MTGTPITSISRAADDLEFDYLVGVFDHADGEERQQYFRQAEASLRAQRETYGLRVLRPDLAYPCYYSVTHYFACQYGPLWANDFFSQARLAEPVASAAAAGPSCHKKNY